MTELRITQFVQQRLADPQSSGAFVADPAWREFLLWSAEVHQIDGVLDGWYWLERRCKYCGVGWMQYQPDRPPTEIGPERGCATIRRIAQLFKEHDNFDQSWIEPAPVTSRWGYLG